MSNNRSYNQITILNSSESNRAKASLSNYDIKFRDIATSTGMDLGNRGDYLTRGGQFFPAIDQYALYLAIKTHFPNLECGQVIQLAGGTSPLLYVLESEFPQTEAKLVGVDLDPYYRDTLGKSSEIRYELVCMDAKDIGPLGLQKPVIVFSYHFLDFSYFQDPRRLKQVTEPHDEEKERLTNLVDGIIRSLPKGSILISQVYASPDNFVQNERGQLKLTKESIAEYISSKYPNNLDQIETDAIKRGELDYQNGEQYLWQDLNRRKELDNTLLVTVHPKKPDSVDAIVMISRVT
jgi:hypothetical protein